jgi:hypothetical protein
MLDKNISGLNNISAQDKMMYEKEYKRSAELFTQALNECVKSQNMYQREEFKDVMQESMKILNQTARQLMRKELLQQNEQIAKDFATFQKFPEDPDTQEKLLGDLEKAKKLT